MSDSMTLVKNKKAINMTTMSSAHKKVLMPSSSKQSTSRRQGPKRRGRSRKYNGDDLDTVSPLLSEKQRKRDSLSSYNLRFRASTLVASNMSQKSEDNTWEQKIYLNCADYTGIIEKSKRKATPAMKEEPPVPQDKKRKSLHKEKKPTTSEKIKKVVEEVTKPQGFDRGLQPDKVIFATYIHEELMLMMLWKGCDETDLVPARQANMLCPLIVIQFYEDTLRFSNKKPITEKSIS